MIRKRIYALGAAAAAAGALMLIPAVSASATVANHSRTTSITARPDGGNHDSSVPGASKTWANDGFSRSASIHLVGEVGLSHCGGSSSTGHCYLFTGRITDSGGFRVNPTATSGSGSPQAGTALVVALTGSFSGGSTVEFYSTWKSADRLPPASENDGGSLPQFRHTTGRWVLLFFRSSGPRWFDMSGSQVTVSSGSVLLNTWSWTYKTAAGAGSCSTRAAQQWVDSFANGGGGTSAAGDILAGPCV